MNRFAKLAAACALATALALAAPAGAAVPSPVNSTLPACMVLCPLGDIPFTVTIRDFGNLPIQGSMVTLDFSGCPDAFFCRPFGNEPYIVDLTARTIRMQTDAAGTATFPAHIGGTGAAGCAVVFADGVLMRSYALATPDQNGNGVTANLLDPGDNALFNAKLGTADPTADFDCDGGLVDEDDQAIYYFHAAQSCDGYVDPVSRRSWGSLKLHYR